MPSGHYPGSRHRFTPRSRSGLKGVIFCPHLQDRPWKAYLRHRGIYMNLGYFTTKEEAAAAYNKKALLLFGLGTYLNPVPRQ